jgi:hypothetical protein
VKRLLLVLLLVSTGCRESLGPRNVVRDHAAAHDWNDLLGRVVTPAGLVDYDLLERERNILDAYVEHLSLPCSSRGNSNTALHAMWLNAYNALVLFQVLERGRPASVRDVKGLLPIPGLRFFVGTEFDVTTSRVSLWEIEHERVRLTFTDYRDHAAMNCASMSCPPLRPGLYPAQGLGMAQREQMTRWVNDPTRGVRVDRGEAIFSALFDWYARDFNSWSGGRDLCAITARFAKAELADQLTRLSEQGCPHSFMEFDWALNDGSVSH